MRVVCCFWGVFVVVAVACFFDATLKGNLKVENLDATKRLRLLQGSCCFFGVLGKEKNAYTSTAMSCVCESPSEKVFRVVSTEKLVYPTRDSWDPRMFGLLFSSNPFAILAKVRKGGKKHDL